MSKVAAEYTGPTRIPELHWMRDGQQYETNRPVRRQCPECYDFTKTTVSVMAYDRKQDPTGWAASDPKHPDWRQKGWLEIHWCDDCGPTYRTRPSLGRVGRKQYPGRLQIGGVMTNPKTQEKIESVEAHLARTRANREESLANLQEMQDRLDQVTAHPHRSINATAEKMHLNDIILACMNEVTACDELLAKGKVYLFLLPKFRDDFDTVGQVMEREGLSMDDLNALA